MTTWSEAHKVLAALIDEMATRGTSNDMNQLATRIQTMAVAAMYRAEAMDYHQAGNIEMAEETEELSAAEIGLAAS